VQVVTTVGPGEQRHVSAAYVVFGCIGHADDGGVHRDSPPGSSTGCSAGDWPASSRGAGAVLVQRRVGRGRAVVRYRITESPAFIKAKQAQEAEQ
jgi:hypothetical protein